MVTVELNNHQVDSKSEVSARVVAVQDDLITLESVETSQGFLPLTKNEVIYILPSRKTASGRQEFLKAEILRISGIRADAQVYESTSGVGVGDGIMQTHQMLSVDLGPGLLGMVYDGLQNPLEDIAITYGTFLPRGVDINALKSDKKWLFTPNVKTLTNVRAGDILGFVSESKFKHRIMAPFDLQGVWRVEWVQQGSFTVTEPVIELVQLSTNDADLEFNQVTNNNTRRLITLSQRWPIRTSIAKTLTAKNRAQRGYPCEPLSTTIRLIDTFFPIAKGGTGCIPGPFGAGKTVLQGLISRYSNVDIVIVVACGERAGEVVETIHEFPSLVDPKTGGTLMDRTIIICNTSSMPVAAREASIYTGITLGEYYQAMGYDVLLIADSTSRWAQAMRETSGRLEEIPGEEAFPAYLDSAVKEIYERAGVLVREDESSLTGTLTMIGTVSPAGGNFEEPVTQSTLSTVKTFLGLSAERAYRRFYPAVDPLQSWSRYFDQLNKWFDKNLGEGWSQKVATLKHLLHRGDEIERMMQVTGEEGVTTEDFIVYQKSMLLDQVYLQQDAFDAVDVSVPLDRQIELLALLEAVIQHLPDLHDKNVIRNFYTEISGLFKNLNYTPRNSEKYFQYQEKIQSKLN